MDGEKGGGGGEGMEVHGVSRSCQVLIGQGPLLPWQS